MEIKLVVPKNNVKYDNLKANLVPKRYREYLTDMNNLCANFNTDFVHGRDKEIKRIFNSLLKIQNPNIVLLGERGVGKTVTVQAAVKCILKKQCPEKLMDHHFIHLNIQKIIAASLYEKRLENELKDIFNFLTSYSNIVVIIDEIHLIEKSSLLIYYLQVLLTSPNVKVIGITTEEEFYTYFAYESKMTSLIDVIPILEPKPKKIYSMIYEYIHMLEKSHGVTISEDLVEYTISVSAAFPSEMSNPGLALNFIEKSMIVAKERNHKEVLREDVNFNFHFNYELYEKISPEDKKITAYHEAGHFIVSKLSENIRNYKTTAITIVPAEDFLGVTMFEFEPEKQTSCDSDYYIDNIATDLAGRVAETILQGKGKEAKLTSGAYSDLKNATKIARKIVTEFGMIESCGHNMTYFCNYSLSDLALLSEERKKLIDDETQKIINKAYERAEKILTENRELLDLIASELLSNEVLDEKDLDRLCSKVLNPE